MFMFEELTKLEGDVCLILVYAGGGEGGGVVQMSHCTWFLEGGIAYCGVQN